MILPLASVNFRLRFFLDLFNIEFTGMTTGDPEFWDQCQNSGIGL